MKRILVLYKELAGYFLACLDHLCNQYDVQADVVAYPVHHDAPFLLQHSQRIRIYSRPEYDEARLKKLISEGNYNLIFVGGWFDKTYLRALSGKACPALLGFDNQWNGSIKQRLSAVYGRMFIRPKFEYAFVPGDRQLAFARNLGFSRKQITTGAYSCDVNKFLKITRKPGSPQRLIYMGRYAEEKFVEPLFEIFEKVNRNTGSKWQLHAAGTGPLWAGRKESNAIIHHGFMQPEELSAFMDTGDAFILPSTFEPWGVVVHEFATAGYPLLLSTAVGAGDVFLSHQRNGLLFQAGSYEALEEALDKLMRMTPETLHQMGLESRKLAKTITPETWSSSLHALMS